MAQLPKWNDEFLTDPLNDPRYNFHSSYTYNAGAQRLQIVSGGSGITRRLILLNSNNNTGSIEIDGDWFQSATSGQNTLAFRAFGYLFMFKDNSGGMFIAHEENQGFLNATSLAVANSSLLTFRSNPVTISGNAVLKWVKTTTDILFFIDGMLIETVPARDSVGDFLVFIRGGSFGGMTNFINKITVNADSSLPTKPEIRAPSVAGSINAAQEVIASIPSSRLFVDLGAFSGTITGVASAVWDPLSVKTGPVAMAQDTGIPDRVGSTIGDYYLEIPANGVAFDYRLVFKDEFVTTNIVATGDAVDFDVTPSPATQTGSVAEDDDLHAIFNIDNVSRYSGGSHSLVSDLGQEVLLHNYNSDGNALKLVEGDLRALFDGITNNATQDVIFNSSVVFPMILDLDLGKEYTIKSINTLIDDTNNNPGATTAIDIYSNTVPFSGSGLGQGTSESTAYPVNKTVLPVADTRNYRDIPSGLPLDFTTRYLRFVVLDLTYTDVGVVPGNGISWGNEYDIQVNDLGQLDSVNDNAQFEVNTGGGFVAYPAGGVTQGSGAVRITLPVSLQLSAGDRRFLSVKYKADLTD